MQQTIRVLLLILVLLGTVLPVQSQSSISHSEKTGPEDSASGPAAQVIAGVHDARVRPILLEVMERNPELASLEAAARASEQRAPQLSSMPDPVAGLTAFLLTPETRVGPQLATLSLSQRFPWFGKLSAREQSAVASATSAWARVAMRRLELVTEVRKLCHELAFLNAQEREVRFDRTNLKHSEEISRARYAAGTGLSQEVVKLQAEITRTDTRLLGIAKRRATLSARLNALRDRPAETPVPRFELPDKEPVLPPTDALRRVALERRPELGAADAEIAGAEAQIRSAHLDSKPDVTAGIRYTLVGTRDDPAARLTRPEDDGQDILGLFASVNLPIRKAKLAAGVEEGVQKRLTAEEKRRSVVASIEGDLGDLVQRIHIESERLSLFRNVLTQQADESLRSAQAAYATGRLSALDLLDAERTLLEVRIGTARSQTDLAVAVARLEGVIGDSLEDVTAKENR